MRTGWLWMYKSAFKRLNGHITTAACVTLMKLVSCRGTSKGIASVTALLVRHQTQNFVWRKDMNVLWRKK